MAKPPLKPPKLRWADEPDLKLLSAPPGDLTGLPLDEQVHAIEGWFYENFQESPHEDPYYRFVSDDTTGYTWGPYDPIDILHTVFDNRASPDAIDRVLGVARGPEGDVPRPAWVPHSSRIIAEDEPRKASHAEMLRRISELESRLAEAEHLRAGQGHNHPPEPIDEPPLDSTDSQELKAALETLKTQPVEPVDNAVAAKAAAEVVDTKGRKLWAWLVSKREVATDGAVKSIAGAAALAVAQAIWVEVYRAIVELLPKVMSWLFSFLHF